MTGPKYILEIKRLILTTLMLVIAVGDKISWWLIRLLFLCLSTWKSVTNYFKGIMILSPILCRQRCHQHKSSQVSSQTMMEKNFTLKRFELSGLILMIYIVIKIFNLNIVILTSEHTDSSLVCSVLFIPDTQLNV